MKKSRWLSGHEGVFFSAKGGIDVAGFVAGAGAEVDGVFWAAVDAGEAEGALWFDPDGVFSLEGDSLVGAEINAEATAIAGIGDAEFFGIAGFIVSRVDEFSEQCGQGAFAAVVVAVGVMDDFLLDDNEAGGGAAEDLLLFFDIGDGEERDVIFGRFYRELGIEGDAFGGEGVFEETPGLASGAAAGEHEIDVCVVGHSDLNSMDEFGNDVGNTEEIDGEDETDIVFVFGVEGVMGVAVGLGDGDDRFVFRTELFDSEEGIAGRGEVKDHGCLLVLVWGGPMGYGGEGIYRSSVISLVVGKFWTPFGTEATPLLTLRTVTRIAG